MDSNTCYSKDVLLLLFLLVPQVHTKISGPPRLSASGYQMHHISKAGENIKLHCPLEPNFQTPPLVSWNKDDESIHVGWNRIKILDNDKVLRIKELEVTDSGVYVCKATNGFGSVEAKHLLYVHVNDTTPPGPSFNENIFENIPGKEIRPKFLHASKMEPYVVAPSGGTVYLPCEATGRPKPEILWYRESRQLFKEDLNGLAGEVVQDHWKLKISPVKDRHAGKYTCKLFNSVGSLNFTFTIHVAASNADEEPLFVEGHLKNTTAYYGHPANFECVVRSTSVPLLQWLKPVPASSETKFLSSASTNNTVILNNQRYLILQGTLLSNEDVYSNTLSISSVHHYDYGMYICSVASNQGLLHRSVFLLPHSDESSIQNEAQVISPGYYFIFGIIVSLSVTLLIIFVTVIICCRRTTSFKQKDLSTANQPAIPNRPCSRNQQTSIPHQTPVFPETSVQGSWQLPTTYFPPMDEPTPTAEVTSNIQVYYQANGPHNFPGQEDNQAVLKAHHYSLISGSTASHQTPPSMVSASSSQKQFFYRPPFRQQQPPLLGGNHTIKD